MEFKNIEALAEYLNENSIYNHSAVYRLKPTLESGSKLIPTGVHGNVMLNTPYFLQFDNCGNTIKALVLQRGVGMVVIDYTTYK